MSQLRVRHVADVNPPCPTWDRLPEDTDLTFVPLEAVWPRRVDVSRVRPKEETSSGYTRFQQGDVIVPKITPTFEADRSTWVEHVPTVVATGTTELHVVRARPGVEPRYLDYLFSSAPFLRGGEAEMIGVAGQKRVPDSWLRDFPVPIADILTQRAIADHLDAETARIDALIAKKQQLIHLLEERRAGLAMDAIRGGSVAGPRAPSGMPWLGTIPGSWEMPPIYARYDVLLGRMLNAERATGGDQRPYLRNINVRWLDVNLADVATMDFPEGERARYLLKPGDLLICEGGAGYGRAAVWDGRVPEMYFQKSLHRVRPLGPWPVRWLAEFLRAGKAAGAFEAGGNLATIPHLTAEQLRAYRVPMPPTPAEAQAILDRVDRQAESLARTSASVERQLCLLAEHRQALITATVSAQPGDQVLHDVARSSQPRLPARARQRTPSDYHRARGQVAGEQRTEGTS